VAQLHIVLIHGASGSGKTYATERVLAIDYHVTTCRMDALYAQALEHAGISSRGTDHHRIHTRAHELREGVYDARTAGTFFAKLAELIQRRVGEAHAWRVAIVFEGYTLRFPDEVMLVRSAAEAIAGDEFTISRIHLRPTPKDLSRNRAAKLQRRLRREVKARIAMKGRRARELGPPEPVEGVDDYSAADLDEVHSLADDRLKLRPFKWYQRFKLGPVRSTGRIDAAEKLGIVGDGDLIGRDVLDICCNTGVHAIMAKDRGAARVVGVERNPRSYCKALELRKVLHRHAGVDGDVTFLLADAAEILPGLGRFDTVLFFGALHYFVDYQRMLRSVAAATAGAAYVEFTFSEGGLDTAAAPGAVRPWVRKTGKTIYMGDRDAIVETVEAAMPDFTIEARTPVTRRASDREIWRLRRTEPRMGRSGLAGAARWSSRRASRPDHGNRSRQLTFGAGSRYGACG